MLFVSGSPAPQRTAHHIPRNNRPRIPQPRASAGVGISSVAASVIQDPASPFEQTIVISAGSSSGIRVHDAVVTDRGLVGEVTKVAHNTAQVTLLTDKESAVIANRQGDRPARISLESANRLSREDIGELQRLLGTTPGEALDIGSWCQQHTLTSAR